MDRKIKMTQSWSLLGKEPIKELTININSEFLDNAIRLAKTDTCKIKYTKFYTEPFGDIFGSQYNSDSDLKEYSRWGHSELNIFNTHMELEIFNLFAENFITYIYKYPEDYESYEKDYKCLEFNFRLKDKLRGEVFDYFSYEFPSAEGGRWSSPENDLSQFIVLQEEIKDFHYKITQQDTNIPACLSWPMMKVDKHLEKSGHPNTNKLLIINFNWI